jgi:transposase
MFRLDAELKVFVHREAIDFRKSINGLSVLVEQSMKLDPFARAVYAFTNRRRDRVKLLLYERTGFWLLMKRLEADRFAWPRTGEIVELNVEQLHWLLDGIDLSAMRKHPERRYARA